MVQWASVGSIQEVQIDLKLSCSPYNTITTVTAPNTGSYNYTVDSSVSSKSNCYRIEITASKYSPVHDAATDSTSSFSIVYAPSSISITYPTSSTKWYLGGSYMVQWASVGSIQEVQIDLKLSCSPYNTITTVTAPNTGSYNYTVDSSVSSKSNCYRIEITASKYSPVHDAATDSTSSFSIVYAPSSISITYPTSSTKWYLGGSYMVQWASVGSIQEVQIDLKLSCSPYNTITTVTAPNTGSYNYTVDSSVSSKSNCYRIEITASKYSPVHDAATDSTSSFSIVYAPSSISITYPTSSTKWYLGGSYMVQWASVGSIQEVQIDLKLSCSPYNTITTVTTPNTGSYNYTADSNVSSKSNCYRIEITASKYSPVHDAATDSKTSSFSILYAPSNISITYPTSSTTWYLGGSYMVQWTSVGSIQEVQVELKLSCSPYNTITTVTTPNTGSYNFSINSSVEPKSNCYRLTLTSSKFSPVHDVATSSASSLSISQTSDGGPSPNPSGTPGSGSSLGGAVIGVIFAVVAIAAVPLYVLFIFCTNRSKYNHFMRRLNRLPCVRGLRAWLHKFPTYVETAAMGDYADYYASVHHMPRCEAVTEKTLFMMSYASALKPLFALAPFADERPPDVPADPIALRKWCEGGRPSLRFSPTNDNLHLAMIGPSDGATALHLAVWHGRSDVVTLLLKADHPLDAQAWLQCQPPDKRAEFEGTVLHWGLQRLLVHKQQSSPCVEALLSHVAALNQSAVQYLLSIPSVTTRATPLHLACRAGAVRVVDRLLELGADIHAKDHRRLTPLLGLMLMDPPAPHLHQLVKVLLERGANIEATDERAHTPLVLAAERGDYALVDLLVSRGANRDHETNAGLQAYAYSPSDGRGAGIKRKLQPTFFDDLLQAVQEDDGQAVVSVFTTNQSRHDAMQSFQDHQGWTALMEAALLRRSSAAAALVEQCFVDPRLQDVHGFSALLWAKWSDCKGVGELLTGPEVGMALSPKEVQAEKFLREASAQSADAAALLAWATPLAHSALPSRRAVRRAEEKVSGVQAKMEDGFAETTSGAGAVRERIYQFCPPDYSAPPLFTGWLLKLRREDIPDSWELLPAIILQAKKFVTLKVAMGKANPVLMLAVYLYTLESDIYKKCNKAMRNYDRQAIKATWQPFIYWLEKALNSLEPVPSRTALYRGIGIPFIMRTFYTGKVVTWPSFTSTSVNHDVATSFLSSGSGLVFVLRTRQGRAVGHLSEFPWEEEVLLPGNSQFRVERLMEPIFGDAGEIIEKEITSEMAAQKSQVIIYMTEVGQK